jgi:hypothetical protein
MLHIHHRVNRERRALRRGENLLGFVTLGRGGALDRLEARVARELEAFGDADRAREHVELDRFANRETAGVLGRKFRGKRQGRETAE